MRIQYNADNSRGIANGQYIIYVNFEADGKDEWDFAEIVYRARFGGIFNTMCQASLVWTLHPIGRIMCLR